MTATMQEAITEAIIAHNYAIPDSATEFVRGIVRRHPHLLRYVEQIWPLFGERTLAAHEDANEEMAAVLYDIDKNKIAGLETVESVGFECVRCDATASIPVVLLKRRREPVCDACRRHDLLRRET